jgi:hypothetical protein
VYHHAAVGVLDGTRHVDEQAQALLNSEAVVVAELVDRGTVDVLEHGERASIRGQPTVEGAGDAGVIERLQDLPFELEPAYCFFCWLQLTQDLDCHRRALGLIGRVRQVDLTHTAAADLADDLIGTDTALGQRRGRFADTRQQRLPRRTFLGASRLQKITLVKGGCIRSGFR